MASNPYVIGQWVRGERFYGRGALLEEILEGPRNWIWVLGTRRVGKTSLLKHLEQLTADGSAGWFPVFWDFQGAEDADELRAGFEEALLDSEERLQEAGIRLGELEGKDLFDSLAKLRRRLRSEGRRVLLLCDEVEELIKLDRADPSLLRKLRRALQSREDIRSVLVSTIRLWALAEQRGDTSPFLHGFAPPLYIQRLNDDESRALIRQEQAPAGARPELNDEIVETIRECCDNHPYLMQLVCKRHLEEGNLTEAIEQVAGDQMVSYFFSVDFDMLSDIERDIIRVIAERSSAASASIQGRIGLDELGGTLRRLENLGYIRRNREQRFELVNEFFRRWLGERDRSDPTAPPGTMREVAEAAAAMERTDLGTFDGRYRLLEKVGEGATGVVYKAHDKVLRAPLAIKVLKPVHSAHPEPLERFRQEVLLSRDLGHPNILKIYHLGECEGRQYLTMQWIEGPTLDGLMKAEGPLPLERALAIAGKLVSALEAAHSRKVIHRDIKPQNVLLDAAGEPFLTDFGLARLLDAPGVTQSGVFLGTPDYASPEQARLEPLDERSDLYSLGLVLFEMLTGQKPFRGDSVRDTLEKQKHATPPDPRALRPEIPAALAATVLRCLAKDPAERFQAAAPLREALAEAAGAAG